MDGRRLGAKDYGTVYPVGVILIGTDSNSFSININDSHIEDGYLLIKVVSIIHVITVHTDSVRVKGTYLPLIERMRKHQPLTGIA